MSEKFCENQRGAEGVDYFCSCNSTTESVANCNYWEGDIGYKISGADMPKLYITNVEKGLCSKFEILDSVKERILIKK